MTNCSMFVFVHVLDLQKIASIWEGCTNWSISIRHLTCSNMYVPAIVMDACLKLVRLTSIILFMSLSDINLKVG